MVLQFKTLYCPVCKEALGTFDEQQTTITTCQTYDCRIKFCFKYGETKPVALDWPGKRSPKACTCMTCVNR